MQVNFLIFKIGTLFIEFSINLNRNMQLHSSPQPFRFCGASSYGGEIFSKYQNGGLVDHLPFQLYKSPSLKKRSNKKGGARGPYRRYSSEEKLQIIQRMLNGEPLKKIAQKTMIPKRNLIRWKHEYLHQDANLSQSQEMEQSVEFYLGETDIKKDSMETKENLATESTDLIRLQ